MSDSNVQVRLKLLGAAAFSRDAKTAARDIGRIDPASRRAASSMSRASKASDRLGLGFGALAGTITRAGVIGGLAGLSLGIAGSVKNAATFEQQMSSLEAVTGVSGRTMDQFKKQAMDAGAATKFSALEAGQAQTELAKGGVAVKDIMSGGLKGALALAAAGEMGLADAASVTANSLNLFKLNGSQATHVADGLATAANATTADVSDFALALSQGGAAAKAAGLSFDETTAFLEALALSGVKGSDAGTSMKAALVHLAAPGKKAQEAMSALGLSFFDANHNMKSLPAIAGMLDKSFKGLGKEQQLQAAATIAGTDGMRGLLALYDSSPAKLRKLEAGLKRQGTAAEVAAKKQDNLAGKWENFKGSLETASIAIATPLLPVVTSGVEKATAAINKLTTAFRKNDVAGTVSRFARGAVAGARGKVAPGGRAGNLGADVGRIAGNIGRGAAKAGRQLLDAFAPAMPFFKNVLVPLLKGVAKGIIGSVVVAFKVLVPTIKIAATALGWIGTVLKPLKGVFEGVGMVIGFIAAGPILKLLGLVPRLGLVFRVMALPIRANIAVFKGLLGIVGRVWGVFGKALAGAQRFVGTFSGLPARVARAALNLVGSIVRTVETIPGKMLTAGKAAGRSIIDGIVSAIKAAPNAILNAVLGVLPGPVRKAVSGLFGGGEMMSQKDKDRINSQLAGAPRHRATGGTIGQREHLTLVGETGPELISAPGHRVLTAHQTSQMMNAGRKMSAPALTLVVPLTATLDGKVVHQSVVRHERLAAEAA